ncbi:ABC transporter substrate-binding protein [Bacillus horti]|uniref:Peptide/nickel transport system substrate-binding protein n=1 Tax=Caldalkalibacillus horti TaxID=77523 RepID=A0ABT9W0P3_9BACI|nr:ABC transporter substrate-binding protein [Bacillus horti]MDQ0166825.1 peptide/nickel transport system substrate-binding protein [Bacillus horti]
MKKWFSFFVVAIMALFIAACASDSAKPVDGQREEPSQVNNNDVEVGEAQSGGVIRIGIPQEPDTLDMHRTNMGIASFIGTNFGGGLLSVHPETGELEPYLAESYHVSDDGTTITFTLKEGITFHDGSSLTAGTYKETFDRILQPETGVGVVASMVGDITEVSIVDEYTFALHLAQPSAPLLRNLAIASYLQPLPLDIGEGFGRLPVGVGQYRFVEWNTGQSIKLERYDDYNWGPAHYTNQGTAYPDEIELRIILDNQTMLTALDSGSIDIAYSVSPRDAERYRSNENYYIVEEEIQGIGLFMQMNTENEILQDTNVRRALNMAIDKEAIIQAVLGGQGSPAHGPLSSTTFGYDPEVENYSYSFHADEAIALLEQAGFEMNARNVLERNGQPLSFELSSMEGHNQAAQIVQAMLRQIGIEVNIQSYDAGTLIERVSQGEFELSFLTYAYPDPDILYNFFHSSMINVMNHVRVSNEELDTLLEAGKVTMDPNDRQAVYAEAQQLIVEEAYWVPIYTNKVFHIVKRNVQNVKMVENTMLLHDSWVTP